MDTQALRKKYLHQGRTQGAAAELGEFVGRLALMVGQTDVEAALVDYTKELDQRRAALEAKLEAERPVVGAEMAAAKRLCADIDELKRRRANGEDPDAVISELLARARGEAPERDEDDETADAMDRLFGPVGDPEPPPPPRTWPRDEDDETADAMDRLFGTV